MKITRYSFPINKKTAILADIHNSPFDIDILIKEKPDWIFIPGDLCTPHLSKEAFKKALDDEKYKDAFWEKPEFTLKLLKELPQIAHTFMSIGNHECDWNDIDKSIVRNSGVVLLDNEYIKIDGIVLGGISSSARHSRLNPPCQEKIKELISDMNKEKEVKILLLHEPQQYFEYGIDKTNIDLVISGHAHGGQWRFFGQGIYSPGQGFFPKYTKGLYNGNLLVSAGMSNTVKFFPRIFNPKEIVMIYNR